MDYLVIVTAVLTGLLLTFVVKFTADSWVDFSVARSMIRDEKIAWDYVSFDKFEKEFNKVDWIIKEDYPESRFTENGLRDKEGSYFHAAMIVIKGKGMVIKFHEMWKLARFKKKLKIEVYEKYGYPKDRVKGLWGSGK